MTMNRIFITRARDSHQRPEGAIGDYAHDAVVAVGDHLILDASLPPIPDRADRITLPAPINPGADQEWEVSRDGQAWFSEDLAAIRIKE